MRYQVEFRIRQALEELQLEARTLAAELNVNPPHLERLRDGTWTTVNRTDLQSLLCWARKRDRELIAVVENPLWRTLSKKEVMVFRGKSDTGNPLASDSNVETELLEALEQEQCTFTSRALDAEEARRDIPELMKTTNCVFIGSPKLNAATEVALSQLWALKPFDSSQRNQERSPLQFIWESGYTGQSAFGHCRAVHEHIGVYVGVRDGSGVVNRRHAVPVDWKPAKAYANWVGKAKDAGVTVACYKPLGTNGDVTTIVLAGHSGFATHDMALDLVRDGLRFETDELRPNVPTMKVLWAPYKKLSGLNGSRVRLAKGRRWFELPWTELQMLAKKRTKVAD